MTNTKFRKRALLSSVAMLLVALVALGSATFAWFTNSTTANAAGLSFTTTTQSGIVVASQTAINTAAQGTDPFGKTTVLNKQANGQTGSAITFDPASFVEVDSTSKAPKLATTKSDDPGDATAKNATTPAAITAINVPTSGISTTGVFMEKVYLKSTGADTAVQVSNVTIDKATGAKDAIYAATYCLIVDQKGKVLWHKNSGGNDATGAYLNTNTGTYTNAAVTASRTAPTSSQITDDITGSGEQYVWVIVYLDGENSAVYTTNVDAQDIVSKVDVQFAMVV